MNGKVLLMLFIVAFAYPYQSVRPIIKTQHILDCKIGLNHSNQIKSRTMLMTGYDANAYAGCFQNCEKEWHGEIFPTFGAFPDDLMGTFFTNGPGKFEINGQKYKNPFEGDGMVCAVTFTSGETPRAHFRNRFIQTNSFERDRKASKITRSNSKVSYAAGWAASLLNKRRNTGNKGVMYYGRLCLALWDMGLPWKIDPKNLDTFFQDDFKGYLRKGDKGGESMGSRTRIDSSNNRLVIFGYDGESKVCVREFNQKLQCGRVREEAFPGGTSLISDFAITERFYIFSVPKISLDKLRYSLGLKALDEGLSQQRDAPTNFILIPRSADKNLRTITIPGDPHICWSIANAYDNGDDTVLLDMLRMDPLQLSSELANWTGAGPGLGASNFLYSAHVPLRRLVRYVLSTDKSTVIEQRTLSQRHCDYGIVNLNESGRKHRYVYCGVGREKDSPSPIQGVCRIDTETGEEAVWFADEHQFWGAIAHAPSSKQDSDGYIVGILTDGLALTSEIAVFEANNIPLGPVTRASIVGNIPPSFGAWFSPGEGAAWDPEALEKSFSLANLFERKGWNEAKSDFSSLGMNMLE